MSFAFEQEMANKRSNQIRIAQTRALPKESPTEKLSFKGKVQNRHASNCIFSEIPVYAKERCNYSPESSLNASLTTYASKAKSQLCADSVKAKSVISESNDIIEQEADKLSEKVLRTTRTPLAEEVNSAGENEDEVTAKSASCDRFIRAEVIKNSKLNEEGDSDVPCIVNETLRSHSEPLEPHILTFMNSSFGYDFSRVRVHSGELATASAKAINALAYTKGQHVVFGAGQYAPHSSEGRKLLAHELVHVIQNQKARNDQNNQKAVIARQTGVTPRPTRRNPIRVTISGTKDGTALIVPYSHARGRNDSAIYTVPTYRMTVQGLPPKADSAFKVIRFGLRRGRTDPVPPSTQLRCNAGRTGGGTYWPFWNPKYSPFSIAASGLRGGYVLYDSVLIHEGPPTGAHMGALGCFEVAGSGEWDRFLNDVQDKCTDECFNDWRAGPLKVKVEAASRPVARLTGTTSP